MGVLIRALSTFAGLALVVAAQPATPRLSFEVATVRPSTSGYNGYSGSCHGVDSKYGPNQSVPPLGRCVITDARLSHLIGMAYQLNGLSTIHNSPDWVMGGDERFDIQGKAEDQKATEAQLLQMLQTLLEDRFQLKYHRESHDESGFALVLAKNGPKLEKSKDDEMPSFGSFNKANPTITISPRKYTMAMLASFLSTFGPGGHVKDETGLDGFYNFTLTYNETDGPSVTSAIQQLGLRLESRKIPISWFVIDSAQRPGEN